MTTIVAISGSLRQGSYNTALLRNAQQLMPEGATLDVVTLHGIPLYDGDAEAASGVPEVVNQLQDRIAAADGLLLGTPEYNNGIPGVFKNGIDWLSRPAKDIPRIFGDKPTAIVGASPGGFGTILSQAAWWPVLRSLNVRPWFGGRLLVSRAGGVFDAQGAITDAAVKQQLEQFLRGFVGFVKQ